MLSPKPSWLPGASLATLRTRAQLYADIRQFFALRQVMEVQPSLLIQYPVTDPFVGNLALADQGYLHSSPEFQMKRLLAAGSGDIYSLGPVFRAEEQGRRHSLEFCLLEWYRLGFDDRLLALEVIELVETLAKRPLPMRNYDYGQLFRDVVGICPHQASLGELQAACKAQAGLDDLPVSGCLDLLMSLVVEPCLDPEVLTLIQGYPRCQSALARRVQNGDGQQVACRFELYWQGLELANGYHELCDPKEQQRRMAEDLAQQPDSQAKEDQHLLDALAAGLPDCAGVALGVDRLLMALLGERDIAQVQTFRWPYS